MIDPITLQTVRKVFLDQLPKQIKNMLILHDDVSLEQMALLANKFSPSSGYDDDLSSNRKDNLSVKSYLSSSAADVNILTRELRFLNSDFENYQQKQLFYNKKSRASNSGCLGVVEYSDRSTKNRHQSKDDLLCCFSVEPNLLILHF